MIKGFSSPEYSLDICAGKEEQIMCPENYVIVVNRQYLVSTGRGCPIQQK
jgi:hypothetical protein